MLMNKYKFLKYFVRSTAFILHERTIKFEGPYGFIKAHNLGTWVVEFYENDSKLSKIKMLNDYDFADICYDWNHKRHINDNFLTMYFAVGLGCNYQIVDSILELIKP